MIGHDKAVKNLTASLNQSFTDSAEFIIRYLEYAGIDQAFGIPGGAVEPLFNALARSRRRNGIHTIIARHESGAAFMADGYMRETGKLAVCVTTSGPGATNLITGVACAYENKIPMLILTGQPAMHSFGRGAFQESSCTGVNVVSMFRHCTHYNSLVSHEDQMKTKLSNALLKAYQMQGPVHLSIPVDIMRQPMMTTDPSHFNIMDKLHQKTSIIDDDSTNELAALLMQAKKPVFFIGNGATDSIDGILKVASMIDAVFVTTPDAKGLINPFHPAYRGVFGLGGHQSATDAVQHSQSIIVAFGTEFGEFSTNGWSDSLLNNQLIHVDESYENLLRSPMAQLHVHGRILTVCERVAEILSASFSKIKSHKPAKGETVTLHEPEKYTSDATPIKPQRLMKALSDHFPPDTRFLVDIGNSMMWAPHYLQPPNRRAYQKSFNAKNRRSSYGNWLRVALNFAPMGWAIGAAIGVARANPSHPTVCIAGDGAYLMSGQEISVAAQEELCVVYVILNDSSYGMVKHGQRIAGAEPIGYELPCTDFSQQAKALGIPGHVIESPSDFDNIDFDNILFNRGPTLLDVRIDPEEIPPMDVRLKTLGGYIEQPETTEE